MHKINVLSFDTLVKLVHIERNMRLFLEEIFSRNFCRVVIFRIRQGHHPQLPVFH